MFAHWLANILIAIVAIVLTYSIIAEFCDWVHNIYLKHRWYKCKKCAKTHMVENVWDWVAAPHVTYRWRYLKCPHCGKWSWMKVVR